MAFYVRIMPYYTVNQAFIQPSCHLGESSRRDLSPCFVMASHIVKMSDLNRFLDHNSRFLSRSSFEMTLLFSL